METNKARATQDGNGYRVEIVVRDCDMWVTISHFALFTSKLDADALADKVNAARRTVKSFDSFRCLDMTKWSYAPDHVPFETVPRPSSGRTLGHLIA